MTSRIFKSIFLSTISVLIASILLFTFALNNYFATLSMKELANEAELVSQGMAFDADNYLNHLDLNEDYRITWISDDGTVLFDSKVDASKLENHLERDEIKEAYLYGKGESVRTSTTIGKTTLNYAIKLNDGSFIRISNDRETIGLTLLRLMTPLLWILIVATLVSYIISKRVSKRIVEPMNHLDLDNPLNNQGYDEIAPLLVRIDHQNKQIKSQMEELTQKKKEFDDITSDMKEGLILIDENGNILSMNHSAKTLLNANDNVLGQHFLSISRNENFAELIKTAEETGNVEKEIELNSKYLHISVSLVETNNSRGYSILIYDVTSEHETEMMRREFTANVSHELKTPLQSIMGSSELLLNNMVKDKDIRSFNERIYKESKRLLSLIDDIIRLSELDEDTTISNSTPINLKEIAEEVKETLTDSAEKHHVTVAYDLQNAPINGNVRLVYEIMYNLVDNAIRYNKENGTVTVKTNTLGNNSILSVSDTGIGIPQEAQNRIYERFYRVDKSHSRSTGGTGLGLSIVKHAVKRCNGEITLTSTLNEGSKFTVTFPKAN